MSANSRQPTAAERIGLRLTDYRFISLLWFHAFFSAACTAFIWLIAWGRERPLFLVHLPNLAIELLALGLGYALFARIAAPVTDRMSVRASVLLALAASAISIAATLWGVNVGQTIAVLVGLGLMGGALSFSTSARYFALHLWFGGDRLVSANAVSWIIAWSGATGGLIVAQVLRPVSNFSDSSRLFSTIPTILGVLLMTAGLSLIGLRRAPAARTSDRLSLLDGQAKLRREARGPSVRKARGWLQIFFLDPPLNHMAVGIALFAALGTICLLTLAPFAAESAGLTQQNLLRLGIGLSVGVLVGAFVAGLASHGRIELGLVPWGALAIVTALFYLATRSSDSLISTLAETMSTGSVVGFALLGFGAMNFLLPQLAYLQQQVAAERPRSQIGRANFLAGFGIALGAGIFSIARIPVEPGHISDLHPQYQLSSLAEHQQDAVVDVWRSIDQDAVDRPPAATNLTFVDQQFGKVVPQEIRSIVAATVIAKDYAFRSQIESSPEAFYRTVFTEFNDAALREVIGNRSTLIVESNDRLAKKSATPADRVARDVELAWKAWQKSVEQGDDVRQTPPQLHSFVLTACPPEWRRAGLAQVLWKIMQTPPQAANDTQEAEYLSLFPSDAMAQMTVKRVMSQTTEQPKFAARQLLLAMGLVWLPVLVFAVLRVPQAMARLPLWWAFNCLYRVRVNGLHNVPPNGGGVFVINHSTFIDGLIILFMSARRVRMLAWAGNFNTWWMKLLARFAQVILITGGPKSIQKGLSEARKALQRGELVGIFPEGGITRTGQVREFRPGLMRILDQMPVPILPVYIDQIWGSIFSYAGGKAIWKWPNSIRHRITINIGHPLFRPESIDQVRRAVLEEGANAVSQRQPPFMAPAQKFIRACKRRRFRSKIADSLGNELTGGMLLARSLMLRDLLRKHVLAADEKVVGVLVPPSSPGVIVNMALALDRRVATNLNYTLSEKLINECVQIAGVKHVLTTRRVIEKFPFKFKCDVVFLEDLKEKLTTRQKLLGMLRSYVLPSAWLEARLGLRNVPVNELLTVIFTSGSTGAPKGVMLSQQNIATNVDAIGQVICLQSTDTLIGALPYFHSFGYTITLWGAMSLNVRGAYHVNPLDAQQIGKLTKTYKGTVLLGTPTFLRNYLRKCAPEDLKSLDTVVVGAEKLPQELANAFENRFGIRPVEGYGTTELSPLVSVNVPASRTEKNFQPDSKEGSVGRTVPNVAAKITDLENPHRVLGANADGMLWIKGPNVMLGYMHRPDLTADVIVDGWYRTGDVAHIDDEGFITLTGRMSRFSKIGGEMIPHVQIEEVLTSILNQRNYDEQKIAVTAVPDPKRGERLVVLHTKLDDSPGELCRRLRESGLPNLYIPSEDSFFEVDAIPILGSGKLDLKKMKEVAQQAVDLAQKA